MPISRWQWSMEDAIDTWKRAGRLALFLLLLSLATLRPGLAEDNPAALASSLTAQEALDGKNDPGLLPAIERLARARRRGGDLDEAMALRRRALAITIAASGPGSAAAGQAMAALAGAYIDRQKYLDAEPLLIVAERVLSDHAPADDAAVGAVLVERAVVDAARGDSGPAIVRARRAVEIARRAQRGLAAALRALGAALTTAGRFDEAEPVLQEALALDTKQQDDSGVEAARSLSQLAKLYLRAGRAGDALPLVERATAIDQQRLGAAHPFIADDLHDLGLVYEALKRPDQARRAFTAALAVLERGAGRETPRVAYAELDLSRIERAGGNDAAAETAFRDARRILNKAEAEERRRERRA